jgi:hypothetical protein
MTHGPSLGKQPAEIGLDVAVLAGLESVEFVIAQHSLGAAVVDKSANEAKDRRTIGATIAQIADEDRATALGMASGRFVSQATQKSAQCFDLAVNIPDNIDGTAR